MGVKLNAALGGSVELVPTNTASNYTATMPAETGTVVTTGSTAAVSQTMMATGVAGTGPAFSAYPSSQQTLNGGVWTKLAFQMEEFDTNSNYDTTTYRFTPTVAGYYQINVCLTGPLGQVVTSIYKNGSAFKYGESVAANTYTSTISTLIYLNGSTDYLEVYGYFNLTGQVNSSLQTSTYFQGSMVRGA